jgi:4-carboxymuconolactone decarboxylase
MTATTTAEERRAELFQRYDATALETGIRLQGEFFLRVVDELDQLAPEFVDVWLRYIYTNLYNRNVLDDRTRVLVIIGECCVLDEGLQLPNHIRTALNAGATPAEILEVILQSAVYAGNPKMVKAMRAYRKIMAERGVIEVQESPFRQDLKD